MLVTSPTNTFKYTNTVGGFGLNIAYDPTTGDTDQEDGEAGAAGSTGSSSSIAVTLPTGDYVDGLDMGVAMGKDDLKDGSASATDIGLGLLMQTTQRVQLHLVTTKLKQLVVLLVTALTPNRRYGNYV